MNKLYKKVLAKEILVEKVCEVGVYMPENSNVIDFIREGKPTILVEPFPPAIEAIKKFFAEYDKIDLKEVAIYDKKGKLSLANAGASTFVSELSASPALVNDKYIVDESKNTVVDCVTFDEVDTGDIDVLSIDTEGCEWHVLANIKSKPKVLSVETHGKFYVNPNLEKITQWVNKNGYSLWYKDKSDTIYLRKDVANVSFLEKISLAIMEMRIRLRRAKKIFYRR